MKNQYHGLFSSPFHRRASSTDKSPGYRSSLLWGMAIYATILLIRVERVHAFSTVGLSELHHVFSSSSSLHAPISTLPSHHIPSGYSTFHRFRSTRQRHQAVAVGEDGRFDPFATANTIEPETKTLPQSMHFYTRFLMRHFVQKRLRRKSQEKQKGKRRAMFCLLYTSPSPRD